MICETCNLCESRRLNCHPLEVYFGTQPEAELVRRFPNHPVNYYEAAVRANKKGMPLSTEEEFLSGVQAFRHKV